MTTAEYELATKIFRLVAHITNARLLNKKFSLSPADVSEKLGYERFAL